MRMTRTHILIIILALALGRGLIYAALVPPWQAPDEPAQFEGSSRPPCRRRNCAATSANAPGWYDEVRDSLLTYHFARFRFNDTQPSPDQPLWQSTDLYNELYQGQYGSRLAYGVMAIPLLAPHSPDVTTELYLTRLFSVLMLVAVIYLTCQTAYLIFPGRPLLYFGAPILLLFNPQHTHLMSTVNNGNLAELLATIALFLMARGIIKGFSPLLLAGIGLSSLAAMWAKATAYFLIAPLSIIGLFLFWQYRRYWVGIVAAGAALIGAAIFLLPARLESLLHAGMDYVAGGKPFSLDETVLPLIFRSFWALPGWLAIQLPPQWYTLLQIACLAAGVGLAIGVIRNHKLIFSPFRQRQVQAVLLLLAAAAAALTVQLGWHLITGSMEYRQGRSLYPVVMPISILLVLGWQQFIPKGWQTTALLGLTITMFLFDTMVLFTAIVPAFYSRF
jgi:hypothetical protein